MNENNDKTIKKDSILEDSGKSKVFDRTRDYEISKAHDEWLKNAFQKDLDSGFSYRDDEE